MYLLLLLVFEANSLGYDGIGYIAPSGELPISNSITNAGMFADYSFTFTLSNEVPPLGELLITFPSQYDSNLGIAGSPLCSTTCSLSGNTVTLVFKSTAFAKTQLQVTIFSLKNPSNAGGTGNFKLTTQYRSYVIDMNQVFGTIGISTPPGILALVNVNVLPGSSTTAGDITRYLFTFQSSVTIPAYSWIKFVFPNSGIYIPTNPSCSSYAVTGLNVEGDLQCVTDGLKVVLTGISKDLMPGVQYNIRMTGTNPSWSGSLGFFAIYVFRENTNTLMYYKDTVSGFYIKSADFLKVQLSPVEVGINVSKGNIMMYRLLLRIRNPIEALGFIIVQFPSSFAVDGEYIIKVESGLNDFSYNNTVKVVYSIPLLTLTISNFKAVPAETFIYLLMQLKNPSISGVSSCLVIYTLKPDGSTIIDYNSNAANTTVSSVASPSLIVSYTGSSLAGGTPVTINFQIVPNIQIPAEGYVSFIIPSAFGTSSLICMLTPYGSGSDLAKSCTFASNTLTVQLFISTLNAPSGPGAFQANQLSTVTLTITSPVSSGYYYFILSTFDTSKTLLETGGIMVKINAQPFAAISVSPMNSGISSPTVLTVSLTSTVKIPSGIASSDILATRGYIELLLPTQANAQNLFDLDLGLGLNLGDSVSCRGVKVITGADNAGLNCIVTSRPNVASIGTPVVITVSNFFDLPANTAFEFHLAGLQYFLTATAGTIMINAYSITNRTRTDLHVDSASLIAGTVLPASLASPTIFTMLSTQVSELNELGFSFTTAVVASVNSFLLVQINPTHDAGYCSYILIECFIGVTALKCFCYPGADLISVYLTSGLPAGTYPVVIKGLVNPESVASTPDGVQLYIINNLVTISNQYLGSLSALTPALIDQTAVILDQYCANCVNVNYEFYFRIGSPLSSKGNILITLDPTKGYSLHYSNPKPYCYYFSAAGIPVVNYTCTPYRNYVLLSNLPAIGLATLIRIIISGIKNPMSTGSIGAITVQATNYYSRTVCFGTLPAPVLTSSLVVESITDAAISNYPKNAGATAEYSIFFTPIDSIGPGAQIEIDFPTKNFVNFTNPPDCRVSIGILFISDCIFEGKTFSATVESEYHNSQITIHILNLVNFPIGISESFAIRVIYDSVVLQSSSAAIKVSTTTAASKLTTTYIGFDPKNEGETATYEFHITPSISFSSSEYLTIIFPRAYDKRIGINFYCWATGLSGYLKCTLVSSWTIRISGHDPYTSCDSCEIILFIYGIVNPNHEISSNTGDFQVGVYSDSQYSQLNEHCGELDMSLAPGFLNLLTTTSENLFARTDNVFEFTFSTAVSIPDDKNLGAVWIEFPADYVIKGSEISCGASSFWAGGSPGCRIEYDYVKVSPGATAYAGELSISINGLCNPLFEGLAGFINVKVYDGYNRVILTRSQWNLSKNRMIYKYPGPLIHVNNDIPFYAERGTYSGIIPITLDYPCALNLTLIPYTFGFVFIPTHISLTTGSVSTSFRLSVPDTVEDTQYVINWQIQGEATPTYFTPINKSLFIVTKLKGVPIVFQNIPDIPKGGESIPIRVELKYSPYSNVNLLFSLSTVYTGLSMLPKKMEFHSGAYIGYYQLFVANNSEATSSSISISVLGDDADVYSLSKSLLTFRIYSNDSTAPDVTSIAITQIFRSSARAVFTTNKVCTVYYAYALYGTLFPSFTELRQGGPPSYRTSEIQYGTIYIDSSLVANITFTGLSAATSYTIFAISIDQLGQHSLYMRTSNFTTLPLYLPAIVSLWFSQTYLTPVEQNIIKSAIALVLGLNSWQVVETSNSTRRELASASDQVISLYQVYLIDNPKSDDYPKPKVMIGLLQAQVAYLNSSLNNFNVSAGISGQEVVLNPCVWEKEPYLLGTSDYRSIALAGSLVENGYLFGVAVASDNDTGTPLPYQVAAGLDAANRVTRFSMANAMLKTLVNLTFVDLTPDSNYNVYVVCGNLLPGFPGYGEEVMKIVWKTDKAPAPSLLVVSYGPVISIFVGVLVCVI